MIEQNETKQNTAWTCVVHKQPHESQTKGTFAIFIRILLNENMEFGEQWMLKKSHI